MSYQDQLKTGGCVPDWQLLCTLLRRHYKSLARVAKEIGSNDRHLRCLERGEVQQPRFATGVRLLDLAYDQLPPEAWRRIQENTKGVAA